MIYLEYNKIILFLIICFVSGQSENKDSSVNQGFDNFDSNFFLNFKRNKNSAIFKFGNREFTLFVNRKTWPEAMLECARNSLEIVEVKTMNEARILSRIMLKNRPHAIESVWVGAYEKNTGESRSWRWLSGDNIQDDNELWKNKLSDDKKEKWNECLLLDWHLWENPSFMKASCDRKRGYICQRTITNEPEFNSQEDRRFLRPSTTTTTTTTIVFTKSPATTPTTIPRQTVTKKSVTSTQLDKSLAPYSIKFDTNSSNFYEDYYEDLFKNNWTRFFGITSPISISITSSPRPKINSQIKNESLNYENRSIDPLKLYYAFEGPVVGLIDKTQLPKLQDDSDPRSTSRPKYHKYIIRKKKLKTLS